MAKALTKKIRSPQKRLTDEHVMLAKFLREIREVAGISQESIAQQLGHAQTWVYHREAGIHKISLVDFVRWCRSCNVNPKNAFQTFVDSLD